MHNGWTFVSDAHIVFLEEEYEGGKTGRKSPSSTSSVRGTYKPIFPSLFVNNRIMNYPFCHALCYATCSFHG